MTPKEEQTVIQAAKFIRGIEVIIMVCGAILFLLVIAEGIGLLSWIAEHSTKR